MNKKLFTIFIIAIFLIASVGFTFAADTSEDGKESPQKISVKINWNGDSQTDRPSSITVKLIKDGNVVDTAKLNADNSWSTTFTVSEDGSYSVVQATDLSDYSVSTSGSASSGFIITNTLNDDALGAADVDETLQENTTDESDEGTDTTDNDNQITDNETQEETTGTDETQDNDTDANETDNETQEETTDIDDSDNETQEETTSTDNSTPTTSKGVNTDTEKTPIKNKTNDVKKVEKKVIKKENKKPNVTKAKLRNTGIPIIILVLVAFVAAFVPYRR